MSSQLDIKPKKEFSSAETFGLSFKRKKDFFIALDSDGCVFDSMEIKHKECFVPQTIKVWEWQKIANLVRWAWEFVNLYSIWRGSNRFPALLKVIEFLKQRLEVKEHFISLPELKNLKIWVSQEKKLSNESLAKFGALVKDPEIDKTIFWSHSVNEAIREIVKDLRPFPQAFQAIVELSSKADLMVVSQTPREALLREWEGSGLNKFVSQLAGQEDGTKACQLLAAKSLGYEPVKMLMIGDSWGDYEAAVASGCLFYPIIPKKEKECWQNFLANGIKRFWDGSFSGQYAKNLLKEFSQSLPSKPA